MLARYGGSSPVEGQSNARRVKWRGRRCVAKLIVHSSERGVHMPGGISAKAGFDMERRVYRALGPSWPVQLVDAYPATSGATSGYVVVTTEFRAEPWEAYVPSEPRDASVARRLVRQIGAIHHAGFVHWDLFLKNVLFRAPSCVAVIDFEKAEACTKRDVRRLDFICLISELAAKPNTRGIGLCLLRALDSATARIALDHMLKGRDGNIMAF